MTVSADLMVHTHLQVVDIRRGVPSGRAACGGIPFARTKGVVRAVDVQPLGRERKPNGAAALAGQHPFGGAQLPAGA